jgi:L-ascorbate metabolism protein UlaG (beta-lactamase superfamily)
MKVKWLGHSCFVITSEKGIKVITDPYNVGRDLSYGPIKESADVVIITHDHLDHNNAAAVAGAEVVKGPGMKRAKGIDFMGLPTHHDEKGGRERGENTVFCFTLDNLRICHLGDLGRQLSYAEAKQIGKVDILFIPVGGFYTIDAKGAGGVVGKLGPRVAIPMHFKTPKCAMPIAGVEPFLRGKPEVRQVKGSEVEFKADQLPTTQEIQEIVVLEPAL